jgi:hypothetical protein
VEVEKVSVVYRWAAKISTAPRVSNGAPYQICAITNSDANGAYLIWCAITNSGRGGGPRTGGTKIVMAHTKDMRHYSSILCNGALF